MPRKIPRVRELDKVRFYFKNRVERILSLKSGCRGEEDYLNTVLILFDFKGVLWCHYCGGAKNVPVWPHGSWGHPKELVCGHQDTVSLLKELREVTQKHIQPGHPASLSMGRRWSPLPKTAGETLTLWRKDSNVPLPIHLHGFSRKGVCVFWRLSHIWDPLLREVLIIRGWSGLHWHAEGHLGSPASKLPSRDTFYPSVPPWLHILITPSALWEPHRVFLAC